jgi:vitamin B12 transporter
MRSPAFPLLSVLANLAATAALAQPIVLEDIVLSANRAETLAARTGASVAVLTEADFAEDGRPFVLDYLTETPGVTVQQTGPAGTVSGFAVRGAPQQYVRVQIDGIEVSDPTGPQVTPYLQGLLIDDVSRIEVLRGSQSALYGGQAVAGVIDITSPRPAEPGLEQRLILEGGSFSTFRGSYSLSGLSDRGDFALTLARLQTDGFSAAEEADGNTEDDAYDTTRISGSGTLYATDRVSLFGAAFYQKEDGDFDGATASATFDAPNTFDTESWGARAGVDLAGLDGRLENRVALSYYHVDKTQDQVDPTFGASSFHTRGARTRAEYIGNYTWSDALDLQVGADYSYERTEARFESGGFVSPSGPDSNSITGIFAQTNWSPSEPLTLNAALRYDEHSEFGGYPTGRLTAAYDLPSDTVLRASVGTGFRAPSNFELFDALNGNPDLEPETSVSADLGIEQGFGGGRGRASATLFWLQIDDLIAFVPDDIPPGFGRFDQTGGTAESKGMELAARWALTERLTLAGGYTYTDAEQADGTPRDRVPRHDLTLRLDGALTDRIDLGLGAQYIADYVDNTGPAESEGFGEDFLLVNARLAYAVTEAAELYVRAENLLDAQYQTARGFSAADQSFYFGVAGRF